MFGLMTVKKHREKVTEMQACVDSAFAKFIALSEENATLRAQLPNRGDKGKFVKREAV